MLWRVPIVLVLGFVVSLCAVAYAPFVGGIAAIQSIPIGETREYRGEAALEINVSIMNLSALQLDTEDERDSSSHGPFVGGVLGLILSEEMNYFDASRGDVLRVRHVGRAQQPDGSVTDSFEYSTEGPGLSGSLGLSTSRARPDKGLPDWGLLWFASEYLGGQIVGEVNILDYYHLVVWEEEGARFARLTSDRTAGTLKWESCVFVPQQSEQTSYQTEHVPATLTESSFSRGADLRASVPAELAGIPPYTSASPATRAYFQGDPRPDALSMEDLFAGLTELCLTEMGLTGDGGEFGRILREGFPKILPGYIAIVGKTESGFNAKGTEVCKLSILADDYTSYFELCLVANYPILAGTGLEWGVGYIFRNTPIEGSHTQFRTERIDFRINITAGTPTVSAYYTIETNANVEGSTTARILEYEQWKWTIGNPNPVSHRPMGPP